MSIVFENSTATCSVFVTVVLRQPAGLFKGGALLEEEADQEERSFLQRHISPTRVSTSRFTRSSKMCTLLYSHNIVDILCTPHLHMYRHARMLTCTHMHRHLLQCGEIACRRIHYYYYNVVIGSQTTHSHAQRERERENLNSNSKTLFYKDCSLGSVKNLSNN